MPWDKNKPSGNMPLNVSDDAIRDNWASLEDALSKEHYFPNDDPNKHGKHTQEFIDYVRSGVTDVEHANEADHATNADNATNADKVDGYDASQIRQANIIPVSDSEGYLNDWIKQGEGTGLDADTIRGLPGDFSCSKDVNGYTKLPNGLIIQWGYVAPSNRNVSLPIPFPNQGLVILTSNADHQGNRVDNAFGHFVDNSTIFVATKSSDGHIGDYPVYWLAIGY